MSAFLTLLSPAPSFLQSPAILGSFAGSYEVLGGSLPEMARNWVATRLKNWTPFLEPSTVFMIGIIRMTGAVEERTRRHASAWIPVPFLPSARKGAPQNRSIVSHQIACTPNGELAPGLNEPVKGADGVKVMELDGW